MSKYTESVDMFIEFFRTVLSRLYNISGFDEEEIEMHILIDAFKISQAFGALSVTSVEQAYELRLVFSQYNILPDIRLAKPETLKNAMFADKEIEWIKNPSPFLQILIYCDTNLRSFGSVKDFSLVSSYRRYAYNIALEMCKISGLLTERADKELVEFGCLIKKSVENIGINVNLPTSDLFEDELQKILDMPINYNAKSLLN